MRLGLLYVPMVTRTWPIVFYFIQLKRTWSVRCQRWVNLLFNTRFCFPSNSMSTVCVYMLNKMLARCTTFWSGIWRDCGSCDFRWRGYWKDNFFLNILIYNSPVFLSSSIPKWVGFWKSGEFQHSKHDDVFAVALTLVYFLA